ncbi:MAG: branched-chain amino acid ABC transporter permease [Atribacterota bacterium]|nr:branched-chain amino acid ABC transporter permease [Atribacterota bacterium]MDD4895828.1 branched-chain amino acid ABC transporter permease [Atribacterota bacterium]MDD5637083.1 branched-chain amino acid ABC transporter permease [Atribacterota bacterium]
MKKQSDKIYTLIALIILFLFVYFAQNKLDAYKIRILNLGAIYVTLGVSLNLIYGFTGQFSLGHAGFMAIGAYVTALLVLPPYYKEIIFILEPLAWPFTVIHAPFIVALFLSGLVAALAAFVIGLPVLRLKGDYLGIATLGFAEIIRIVANNIPHITNGALGIKGIPEYTNLWWTVGVAVVTIYIIKGLINSSFGRALMAIRENEIAAEVIGINLTYHKVMSFTISAFFAGVGGGLFACLLTTIDPKAFMFVMTFNILAVVVLGGLGSITGTVIAAFLFNFFLEYLRPIEAGFNLGPLNFPPIPGLRMVSFSVLLLILILYKQRGLMGGIEFSWRGFFQLINRIFTNKKPTEGSAS